MLTIDLMRREVILLAKKYDVVKIDLFGSYVDGSATEKSDVDFLVEFRAPIPSVFAVMGFKAEIETRLSHPVDVVTLPMTRPDLLNIARW